MCCKNPCKRHVGLRAFTSTSEPTTTAAAIATAAATTTATTTAAASSPTTTVAAAAAPSPQRTDATGTSSVGNARCKRHVGLARSRHDGVEP